jgi:hypothetical protein
LGINARRNVRRQQPHSSLSNDRTIAEYAAGLRWNCWENSGQSFLDQTPRAKGYIIQAQRTDTGSFTNYIASGTHTELTDLAPKTTYLLALVAVNAYGANLVPGTPLYITTQ